MEGATLGVTIRDLGRYAAALIDEIERNGRNIVITRYGRAVAFVGPLPDDYEPTAFDRIHVAPRFEGMAGLGDEALEDPEDAEIEAQLGEMSDDERRVLQAVVAAAPRTWRPSTKEEDLPVARLRLEFRGLITNEGGAVWRPTRRGISAASGM